MAAQQRAVSSFATTSARLQVFVSTSPTPPAVFFGIENILRIERLDGAHRVDGLAAKSIVCADPAAGGASCVSAID
jgi:hypothetical protein